MSNILAIAHKEIRSYFASPIAYIVIGFFALIYGYFFLAAVHVVEGSIAAQIEFFLTSAVPAGLALALLRAPRAHGPASGRPS